MTDHKKIGRIKYTSGEFGKNSLERALKAAGYKLSSESDEGVIDPANSDLAAETRTEFVEGESIVDVPVSNKRDKTEVIASVVGKKTEDHSPKVTEFVQDQVKSMGGAFKQLGREGLLKLLKGAGFVEVDRSGNLTPGKRARSAEVLQAYKILTKEAGTGKGVIDKGQKEKRTKEKNPKMPKQKKMAITDPRFTELINKNPDQSRRDYGRDIGQMVESMYAKIQERG